MTRMDCSNRCLQHKKSRGYDTPDSRYCPKCAAFMSWQGMFCPCCGTRLKTKPRHAKHRRAYEGRHPEKYARH